MSEKLLLHSLLNFDELLFKVFDLLNCRTFVEIGSESGGFTEALIHWLATRQGRLTSIDPNPQEKVRQFQRVHPHFNLLSKTSLTALPDVPPADCYLIDGDHNYYTVLNELTLITQKKKDALIVLHDIHWPWGRRDLYYNPEVIPKEFLHKHSFTEGVTVGQEGLIKGGFRGEGLFACARKEGGARNGVLTAVEDFVKSQEQQYSFIQVPCLFGLGFLFNTEMAKGDLLKKELAVYADNFLLKRLERNRLDLYLKVIELQDLLVRYGI